MKCLIRVASKAKRCQTGFAYINIEFFFQLAYQCLLRQLTLFDLAAGRLAPGQAAGSELPFANEHTADGCPAASPTASGRSKPTAEACGFTGH